MQQRNMDILPSILVILMFVNIGYALQCYVCMGLSGPSAPSLPIPLSGENCTESPVSDGYLKECASDMTYCHKSVLTMGDLTTVERACANESRNVAQQCHSIAGLGTTCLSDHTCSTDGCNHSTSIHASCGVMMLLGFALFANLMK